MRGSRVLVCAGGLVPLAFACASFGPAGEPATRPPDAALHDATIPTDANVDASTVCATVDDIFDRTTALGGPWQEYIHDTDKEPDSSEGIVQDAGGNILQSNAIGDDDDDDKSFAYLRTTLNQIPKSMSCTFGFRPETDFVDSDKGTGKGSGIDILLIGVVHKDGTKTLLRFSYKTGAIEVRDDFTDKSDVCIKQGTNCPKDDFSVPASGMAENNWTSMSITTDFSNVTFVATTPGTNPSPMVQMPFEDIGDIAAIQLYLGVINFGKPTQLGSYDHFHCELHC